MVATVQLYFWMTYKGVIIGEHTYSIHWETGCSQANTQHRLSASDPLHMPKKKKFRFLYLKQTSWNSVGSKRLLPDRIRASRSGSRLSAWPERGWSTSVTEPGFTWCEGKGLQADETPLEACPVETEQSGHLGFHAKDFWAWFQKHLL